MRAQDLFPELFADDPVPDELPEYALRKVLPPRSVKQDLAGRDLDFGCRPQPPDVSWLQDGLSPGDREGAVEPRQGVILISDPDRRRLVEKALASLGFSVLSPGDGGGGIPAIANPAISLVIGHLADLLPNVHAHILHLPMLRRRMIYYVVVGPRLRTLYGLEALSLSANLVVNDGDLGHLDKILQKGFRDYEHLYGPFLDELKNGIPDFLR